jgi:hypothetical protein
VADEAALDHRLAMRGEQRVVGERHLGHRAAAETLFRHERKPELAPLGRIHAACGNAQDRDDAGVGSVRSPDITAINSFWPLPETPAMPSTSP